MLLKYSDCFAKEHGSVYSFPVQSEVIWRKRQTLRRVLTPLSQKPRRRIGFGFYSWFNFQVRKNIFLFVQCLISGKYSKNQKRRYGSSLEPHYITFSPNLSLRVENSMRMNLKACAQFVENIVSRKRAKQFPRRSSNKTTRSESNHFSNY